MHGNVFKQPDISQDKVDDLANGFLIDTKVENLSDSEKAQARNLTRSIYVVQQEDLDVTVNFVNDVTVRPDASGGVINAVSTFDHEFPVMHMLIVRVHTGGRIPDYKIALQDYRSRRLRYIRLASEHDWGGWWPPTCRQRD